tara:strand:+ start:614 stop:3712 length:3099 start_codon:yes stop_codon:yes gene_type:complete
MRKIFIYVLTLISLNLSAQNSWINIQYLSDNYPSEISWELLDSNNNIVLENGSNFVITTLFDTTINVNSGLYTININDSYGDGLGASAFGGTDGWFLIQNDCQDTLTFVAGDFGSLYTDTLTIAPCAPPTGGCLDSTATNYDPTSTFDDSSCVYPPCSGLDTLWVETYCTLSGSQVYFHWSNMPNPSCRMVSYTKSDSPYGLGSNWYPYPGNFSNTGIVFSNQQPNTTYYFLGMLADSSYTDTLLITTGECILGCTDPTALNYNPWANTPDGSCQAPPANCVNGESNIIVTVIPDTYPGETSWDITDTNGTVLASSPGYSITGVPIITETCVPNGTIINFNLYDGFGDGMCGSCYGGVDGTVLVQTLCGDTILSILPGNADFGMDTITQYTVQPCTPNVISGCMDSTYIEYNPQANVNDGSCITPVVFGCADITSPDYDSLVNTMLLVPNCDYTLVITDGAQDGWFGSWLGILQDTTVLGPYTMGPNDGAQQTFTINLSSSSPVEIMFFAPGNSSTTANQCGFYLISPEGDTTLSGGTNSWTNPIIQFPYRYNTIPQCGNYCTPGVLGCMDVTSLNYDSLANMSDGNCVVIVLGCTNTLAFNYDSLANVDDGNCVSTIIGCMDSTSFNFNPTANTNDQLSCIPVILGCMDDTMSNYDAAANTDDGSCVPTIFGCTDLLAFNYDSTANTNNGSCVSVILGCTDPSMFNYDPTANTNDGSCIPFIYGCMDNTAFNYNILANTDNGSCITVVFGCTDSTQFNYDALANTDNGTCIPFVYGCTDATALNYNPLANTNDNSCIPFIYGCTDSVMFNYNPLANTDNGSCIPFVYGCTDAAAFNYNPAANTNDNTCCLIAGCTDINALNYNQFACFDDNSCITIVSGCTDVAAYNYNPLANVSDTTACNYDAGCYGGPGIPYWLNDGCYAWVIDVDNYCCTNDWDDSCQSMYNYCQDGWPTSIEDIASLGIVVYPNPTQNTVTIETRLEIEVELYNIMGKKVTSESNTKRLDLTKLPNGIYNMVILYNNSRYSKKVIKQ